ncbi:MAG: hypothetical protein WBM44_20420 [Waterburya sp.]
MLDSTVVILHSIPYQLPATSLRQQQVLITKTLEIVSAEGNNTKALESWAIIRQ